jgi:hypothetical protein
MGGKYIVFNNFLFGIYWYEHILGYTVIYRYILQGHFSGSSHRDHLSIIMVYTGMWESRLPEASRAWKRICFKDPRSLA